MSATTTKTPRWVRQLEATGACRQAVEWARGYPSLAKAWKACERGDWMLWLAGTLAGPPGDDSRRPLVLSACECVRLCLRFVKAGEDRPRIAIETAERWARGEGATLEEVRAAADAAYAAANAAAYAAAYAAADAATAAYAAADAAAYAAAYAAADAAADAAAARASTLRECADIVRKHYPTAPKLTRKAH